MTRSLSHACLLPVLLAAACSGGGDSAGPEPQELVVTPNPGATTPGGTLTFAAASASPVTAVVWSVRETGGGTIGASTGLYTAPASTGTFTVVATSVADSRVSGQAAVNVAAATSDFESQLRALSTKRIYYQHASVGGESVGVYRAPGSWPEPYWGLDKLCRQYPAAGFSVTTSPNAPNTPPATPTAGHVVEWTHGSWNGDPATKLARFNTNVRAFTTAPDIAILKLGTPDFDASGVVGTGMTQAQWFTSVYKPTMDALQAAYPSTRFIHGTIPIYGASNYWGNDYREAWNARLRAAYPGRVWDLAYWQSVNRAGNRCVGQDGAPCMHADWVIAGDGHANQAGADWLGENLLAFLASLH